jgi:hypothetical protein
MPGAGWLPVVLSGEEVRWSIGWRSVLLDGPGGRSLQDGQGCLDGYDRIGRLLP